MSGLIQPTGANAVFLKIQGLKKGSEKVYISKSVKTEKGWTQEGEFKGIEGEFKSLDFTTNEFEGKTYELAILTLHNDGVDYKLQLSLSSGLGRGIVNSIVSNKSIDQVKIEVYISSKSGRPSAMVYVNNDKANWALSWDEQTELVEITKNKKGEVVDSDYSALIAKLKELASEVKIGIMDRSVPSYAKVENTEKASVLEDEDDDDNLPF